MALRSIVFGLLVAGSLAARIPLRIDPTLSWRIVGGCLQSTCNLFSPRLEHMGKDQRHALMKVEPTFNNKVDKIRVETKFVDEERPVTLTGWGSIDGGYEPDNLQHIELRTTTVKTCADLIVEEEKVYETQICTLTEAGEGACHGDSGGPLVRGKEDERELVGVVSWGEPCACGYPDVFCRPSAYIDWLNDVC